LYYLTCIVLSLPRYSKPIRERLLKANKLMKGGLPALLPLLRGLKLKDLKPEAPAIQVRAVRDIAETETQTDDCIYLLISDLILFLFLFLLLRTSPPARSWA
jgi:hypothetical protein